MHRLQGHCPLALPDGSFSETGQVPQPQGRLKSAPMPLMVVMTISVHFSTLRSKQIKMLCTWSEVFFFGRNLQQEDIGVVGWAVLSLQWESKGLELRLWKTMAGLSCVKVPAVSSPQG